MTVMGKEGRFILYLSKMWVNQTHALPKCWQHSDGNGGLKVLTGKGE
jgi:hypothetical protein